MGANALLYQIPCVFRILSMLMGIVVIIIYALMAKYRPALADRISLRLVFAANVFVINLTIWQIVVVFLPSRFKASCLAAEFFIIFSDSTASLFLMFVGINLMLLVVIHISPSRAIELGYYFAAISIGVAGGIAVSVTTALYLYDMQAPTCWYQVYYSISPFRLFSSAYRYLFSIAIVVVSTIAFASTLLVLFCKKTWIHRSCDLTRRNPIKNSTRGGYNAYGGGSKNQIAMYKKVTFRCMMYPAVVIFTKIWGLAYIVLSATKNESNFTLLLLDQCISGATGILVGFIFFADPAVMASVTDCKEYLHCRFVDEYSKPSAVPKNIVAASQRRKSVRVISVKTRRSTEISNNLVIIDKVVDYRYPRAAQYTNWILVNILRWKKRPRKCRNPSTMQLAKDDSFYKANTGPPFFLSSAVQAREDDQAKPPQIDRSSPHLTRPEIAITTCDGLRIQFEKYTFSEEEVSIEDIPVDNAVDDDDIVPHFPTHVLNEIHPSPASLSNCGFSTSAPSTDDEDYHTLDSMGLDLEAVGMDCKSLHQNVEKQR